MTAFFVDPGQRATGLNRRSIQSSAIPSTESDSARLPEATTAREIAFVDRDAFCARPPLTAKGIAAYAGVMTTFTGTSGNDAANASTGTLNGFSDGTVTELQDATGDKFVGDAGNDTIVAGSGNDTIDGNSGDDTLYGGAGDDTINLANSDFGFTELIDGGAGSDRIVLTNATTVDFSIGTVSGVETFTGSSGDDIVTVTAEQWAGSDTIDLGEGTDVLNVKVDGLVDIWALSIPASIGGVETGNLSGSSDDDVLMLTGAQLDAIIIGNGTIDLGGGNQDTIILASTSADLNTLGATDASISYVEAIDAYMATAGVTINLSGQSESVRIYGGAGNDTITGGTGGDFVWDGEGVDTIVCGAGDDWFSLMEFGFVAGEMIIGGDDSGSGYRDGIMLVTACPSIDFSTCTVSGFETLIDMAGVRQRRDDDG